MDAQDSHPSKLVKIGNSQAIRIPKRFVERYFVGGEVVLEPTEEGLLITPKRDTLTYEKAAIEMAKENESWEDWNVFQDSGLEELGDW